MESYNIALISESPKVSIAELTQGTGAILRQINDHLSRFWQIRASITAYGSSNQVPLGYWRVTVKPERPEGPGGAIGIHRDVDGQPYADVSDEGFWTIAASHEIIEMLIDPTLSNFRAGFLSPGKRVMFLVEICDPCQTQPYLCNGFGVSDFVTPAYFDPGWSSGAQYSFNGSIKAPLTVLPGGYLVWKDPKDGLYYAYTNDGEDGRTLSLGSFPGGFMAPREWVDQALGGRNIKLSEEVTAKLQEGYAAHEIATSNWAATIQRSISQRSSRNMIKKTKLEKKIPHV